jgi:hypothetical protein
MVIENKIIGDHQSRFRRNRSNFLHSSDIVEKWDFKKAYDSVRKEA